MLLVLAVQFLVYQFTSTTVEHNFLSVLINILLVVFVYVPLAYVWYLIVKKIPKK
jgi:hypothetical protein